MKSKWVPRLLVALAILVVFSAALPAAAMAGSNFRLWRVRVFNDSGVRVEEWAVTTAQADQSTRVLTWWTLDGKRASRTISYFQSVALVYEARVKSCKKFAGFNFLWDDCEVTWVERSQVLVYAAPPVSRYFVSRPRLIAGR